MTASAPGTSLLRFGPFSLDAANARLLRDGQGLVVLPKDLDVLVHLASRAGRLVTKDELLDAVWQRRFVSESVLKNVVSRLRALLGDEARQPRYIETAQRRGYRFIGALAEEPDAGVQPSLAGPPASTFAPGSAALPPPALIGRDDALAWLDQRLQGVATSGLTLAFIAGEAGIGKSSLIASFTRQAVQSAQARLAVGQCVEHAGGVEPYLPLLEAVNALCKSRPEDGLVALMRQVAPTWLVQLPWYLTPEDRRQLLHEVAGATRERMLREFAELLERMTQEQPLILVVEDLHWSDAATLQLLGYLARRRGGARALLLASLRPAEVIAADHPLKLLRQELRAQRLCDELELALFSESDAAEYLAARAPGPDWPEALVRALHEHTGGLPLFVAAVIDELGAESGTASADLPAAQGERRLQQLRQIPRSIFGLIEQQHARLPEATQRWLEAASVAGIEFAHAPLADALEVDAEALESTFSALVRGGAWLRECGVVALPDGRIATRYAFRHAIYRNVLYDLGGAARRVLMHRRIALALQRAHASDLDAIAAELALHFERGQEPALAVRQFALAAHRALRRFAASEAATIARQGLALLEPLAERGALRDTEIELNVELGVALGVLKGVTAPESGHAFARAADLMDAMHPAPARIAALHGIWWSMLARGKFRRAHAMAAQALGLAQERDDGQLAFAGHSAMGITQAHLGDMAQAEQHLQRALDRHRTLDAALPVAMFTFEPGVQLRCYLAITAWNLGQPSRAADHARDALARAEAMGHPMSLIIASFFKGLHHCMAEEFEAARTLAERALRAATEHRLERGAGALTWLHGLARAGLGEHDGGLEAMRQGRAVQLRHGQGYGLTRWHEHYAWACRQAGDAAAALACLDEGLALAEQSGEQASSAPMHGLRAQLLQAAGEPEAAAAACRLAQDLARRQGALYLQIGAAASAIGLTALDQRSARGDLAALLARWSDPIDPPLVARARELAAPRAGALPKRGGSRRVVSR